MQTYRNGNEQIWYEPKLLSVPPSMCMNAPYWYVHNRVVGSARGRGTTWFVQLESLQGALRHYRRGGLFGKLVKDLYLFQGWEKSRSYLEYQLLLKLRKQGVHVPRPIAARVEKRGIFYRADLLSEKIPNANDLVDILQRSSIPSEIYQSIGEEIGKMHAAGVNHTDLNIHNILIDKNEQVWIIDFDKCYCQQGDEWKKANLERLKRSFIKEQGKRNIQWQENEWASLIEGYTKASQHQN